MASKIAFLAIAVLCCSFVGSDAFIKKVISAGQQAAETAVNVTQNVFSTVVGQTSSAITSANDLVTSQLESALNQLNRIDACSVTNGSEVSCCATGFFNQSLCLNTEVTTTNLKFGVYLNDFELLSKEVTGSDIPAVCAPIPQMPVFQVCVKAYDVEVYDGGYCASFDVSARMSLKDLVTFKLNKYCLDSSGELSIEAATTSSDSALINIDTASLNPLMNKEINAFNITRSLIRG